MVDVTDSSVKQNPSVSTSSEDAAPGGRPALQPIGDDKNLLGGQNGASGQCCGGSACSV